MKKLNKTQMEIEELAPRVPKLTKAQTEWAIKTFRYDYHHLGVLKECRCPNCGEKIPVSGDAQTHHLKCPNCGARIDTHRYYDTRGWRTRNYNKKEGFFQVLSVVGDWQVTRLIYMQRWCYTRRENTPWEFYEVNQAWNNPKHRTTYFRTLPKNCMGYHYNPYCLHHWSYECTSADNWTYNKYVEYDNCLEARKPGGANYFDTDRIAPNAKILPSYKRIGISRKSMLGVGYAQGMAFLEESYKILDAPMLETLLKDGAYELFNIMLKESIDKAVLDALWSAYKICRRNKYDIDQDFNEWKDLVSMLVALGLDYRSPKYVCPADLHGMHQMMLKRRIDTEEDAKLREELEGKIDYEDRVARYMDMDIHNDDLDVVVLPNVMAFKDEADHLKHCVFRCKYYERANSLILSARNRNGKKKRWETIEVDLVKFRIKQCYGYGDKFTERHDEIVNLVNENMWQIKKRRLQKGA